MKRSFTIHACYHDIALLTLIIFTFGRAVQVSENDRSKFFPFLKETQQKLFPEGYYDLELLVIGMTC